MKTKHLSAIIILCITGLLLCRTNCSATTTYNWKGPTSSGTTDWNTAANWSPSGIPGASDIAQIGVVSFTNQPSVAGTQFCTTLVFGTSANVTLTVTGTLTVSGGITQDHPGGVASITTTLTGTGTINCASLTVGDNTAPVSFSNTTTVKCNVVALNVTGNIIANSVSTINLIFLTLFNNNAVFNITNDNSVDNTVTVGGAIETTNVNPGSLLGLFPPSANIYVTVNGSHNATLDLTGATPVSIASSTYGGIDFYVASGGTGSSTIEYGYTGASSQTVYTNGVSGLDNSPATYQNISFAGSGKKTVQSGSLLIYGNWSSTSGQVDAVSNTPSVYFEGATESLTDAGSNSGAGVVFQNVYFQGSGTKTISSGPFSVASTGILTMAGTATLAAGGNLTLVSDASSSASVAVIPSGTSITGNVNVQRFVEGSSTSLTKRGYRLISSAVYTGTVSSPSTSKVYDISYLLNNTYISGLNGATNGFNAPNGTNPSAYIYREDILPSNSSFTSGNWKGISKINNTNLYDIGTQKRASTSNVNDTTVNIPIGNGVLFYFIGNQSDNSTQTGSKTVYPFDYPENVVFTQVGQLNSGTVDVRLWYKSTSTLGYTTFSDTTVRGFCFVGNPYASTINWEKFNRNSTVAKSTIYGANFASVVSHPTTIYIYNPQNKEYETYQQKKGGTVDTVSERPSVNYTGAASNMIASGQGFFVKATATTQTLSFRENCKTTTQPASTDLNQILALRPRVAAVVVNDNPPALRFRMIEDSIYYDEVVLSFQQNSSPDYVEGEDAEDLGGIGAPVSLSAMSADSAKLAIDALPLPVNRDQVIPLSVSARASGQYQLNLTQVVNLPVDYKVWLRDSFTGDTVNIQNIRTYSFNIDNTNPATYGDKRIYIVVHLDTSLAVHFLNVAANKSGAESNITWQVNNDDTKATFYLKRSTDNGATFHFLAIVPATGAGSYNFTDNNPGPGKNEYRIELDNNGRVTNSPVATVDFTNYGNVAFMVYPNPTTDMVNLKINNNTSNNYTITVMDCSGYVVARGTSMQPNWQYNATTLLPGIYMINVVDNKQEKQLGIGKFVKD